MLRLMTAVVIFLFSFTFSSAQIETTLLKPDEVMFIKLDTSFSEQQLAGPVQAVKILDMRADTSSLGFITQFSKTKRIVFPGAAATEISKWMNGYLGFSKKQVDTNYLFGVIRKLRISEEITPKTSLNGHQGQARNGWDRGVLIKMEYYLKNDSFFYPLYRFDSLFVFEERLADHAGEFVTAAMEVSLQKLFTVNTAAVLAKGRKVTEPDITGRAKGSNQLPVLTDAVYKKGVYANFNEFKMNDPSNSEYEFRKGELGDVLYVKKDGLEYPERTAWGFCDGKNIYICSADKFSQLIRVGNTFIFKGIKSISKRLSLDLMKASALNLLTNTGEKRTHYDLKYKYYEVDMETGEVY